MTFHIAYSCDDNYVEQTMVSMMSVLENNRKYEVVFYLIENQIKRNSIQKIEVLVHRYGQTIIVKSLDDLLEGLDVVLDRRHPRTIYAKLFLDSLCNVEKILYLDSDTVIMSSLEELWKLDMQHAYIAGTAMPYGEEIKRKIGLEKSTDYFCDGVVLINLDEWKRNHVADKCKQYITEAGGAPFMLSEGVINHVAGTHRITLSPRYNLMSTMVLWNAEQMMELFELDKYYSYSDIEQAKKNPVIIHYLNELFIRPWYCNSDHPYRRFYVEWRKKAGCDNFMYRGKRGIRTSIVLLLNRCLPFRMFKWIYKNLKGRG